MSTSASHAQPVSEIGRILNHRYRIEAWIGRGASSEVYRALDLRTGASVAVKRMNVPAAHDVGLRARFAMESTLLAQLCHPSIVEVRAFDVDSDGTPFLVMELLHGEDLRSAARRLGKLPLPLVLQIVRQVGSALHAAHGFGIVHRDIKPSNLFLCWPFNPHSLSQAKIPVVKVLDFGIAKTPELPTSHQTAQGMVIGTPAYLAPECTWQHSDGLDGRVDQWSLAVVVYKLLSGKLPFDDPDPLSLLLKVRAAVPTPLRDLVADLPESLDAAISRALSKSPADRFATILDFIRALHGIRPLATPADLLANPDAQVAPPPLIAEHDPPLPFAPSPPHTAAPARPPSAFAFSLLARQANRAKESQRGSIARWMAACACVCALFTHQPAHAPTPQAALSVPVQPEPLPDLDDERILYPFGSQDILRIREIAPPIRHSPRAPLPALRLADADRPQPTS